MVKFNFGLGGDDQDSAQGDGTAVPTPSGQDDGATPVITEPPVVEPVIEEVVEEVEEVEEKAITE